MKSSRTLLAEIALIAIGVVAGLAIAEALVRAFAPHVRDHVIPGRMFEIDRNLGWRLRPGASATHATRYFRADYRINAAGFRDRDRTPAKAPGARRLLVFGDSQAFGWGVDEPFRYTSLVEAHGGGLEVVNLAVPGYGLDQEILSYEEQGGRYDADEVVLSVSTFTLARLPYGTLYRKAKPRFVLDANGALVLEPVAPGDAAWMGTAYDALSAFYLPYFVEAALASAGNALAGLGIVDRATPRAPTFDLGALERAMIGRAHSVARSRGQSLALIVDLPPSLEPVKQKFRRYCEEYAIRCLETVLPLPREHYVFGAGDPHWTAATHSLVAAQLLAQLNGREVSLSTARATLAPADRYVAGELTP